MHGECDCLSPSARPHSEPPPHIFCMSIGRCDARGWGVGLGNLIVAPVDQIAFASWGPRPGLEVAVGFPCVVHPFTHGLRMKFHSAIFDPVGPYRRFFFPA